MRISWIVRWLMLATVCGALTTISVCAQTGTQPIVGTVPVDEATASGVLMVSAGRNVLGSSSMVTALDRPAHVSLMASGMVTVCQTSVLHLTESQPESSEARGSGARSKVLLALDRGAMEIRMNLLPGDSLMTPDLRFTSAATREKGEPLDLTMRVTPDGDTCVENRGRKAPTLNIVDAFGESSYQLKAEQHVLFAHGSLKAVNDRESSPCGCPPVTQQELSIAEAVVRGGSSQPVTPTQAAQQHPFPAAASEGLAPSTPVQAETPGTHVQVATTMTFDPAADRKAPDQKAPGSTGQGSTGAVPPEVTLATAPAINTAPPPKTEESHGVLSSVARFFKRIFVR